MTAEEELEKNHNSKEMHAKVKELWRNKKYNNSNGCIIDKEMEISSLRRKMLLIDGKSILRNYIMIIELKCLNLQ